MSGRLAAVLASACALAALGAAAAPGGARQEPQRLDGRVPIGVFPGTSSRSVEPFERRLGRRVDYAHDYIDKRTWRTAMNVRWLAQRWTDYGFAGRTVLTLPMLPDRGSSTMARGARGAYNRRWRTIARRLIAGGQQAAILRVGHEFNGTWFRWSIRGRRGALYYKLYWRQIVRTMRRVEGARFRFDWAPVSGSAWVNGRKLRAARAWPGSRYVDYIGLSVYDQSWEPHRRSASRRWLQYLYQVDGLRWHRSFARAKRRPMTFPEWGLVKRRDDRGGGDSPYFVRKMKRWIEANDVAYHLYFDSKDPDGESRIFGGTFRRAARTFVREFGIPAAALPST